MVHVFELNDLGYSLYEAINVVMPVNWFSYKEA